MNKLKKLLDDKKCFKLICGAGNKNLEEIEKFVAVYAKAGCYFFDISADSKVLAAAQRGLDFAIAKEDKQNYHFCISVGTQEDLHFNKVWIDSKFCIQCSKCIEICPQKAINKYFKVDKNKCIGCLKCKKVCKHNAIFIEQSNVCIENILNFTDNSIISCIELHVSGADVNEACVKWDYLCQNFNGILSLCIGREQLGNKQLLDLVKKLLERRKPYTTIIQADGSPMSGGKDNFKTTLQAVATAELIQNEKLDVYLTLSGGVNFQTVKLAKLCNIDFHGLSFGSYARKILKEYIDRKDFWTNEDIFKAAVNKAENLIKLMTAD